MRTHPFRVASAVALAGLAAAIFSSASVAQVRPAPPSLMAQFDIHTGTVQSLNVTPDNSGNYQIPITIAGQARTISLQPYDLRSPGFQLLVQDATGIHAVPTPACVTFRGILLEDPTTQVIATIENGSLTATIHEALAGQGVQGKSWVVQPVNSVVSTAGPSVHIVYEAADSVPLPFHCGNAPSLPANLPAPTGTDVIRECDIAIEADVEFYQNYNSSSVAATQNNITSVMNQVEFIYNRDCDIQYNITTILVTTTSVYSSSNASTLLGQFRNRWNAVHGGIARDTAHLFTGRPVSQNSGGTIGVAYLGTICNLSQSYGLSQSRYTSNFAARVSLTAHELGHSFNCNHCSGGGCQIMCATNGGCGGNTLFSSGSVNQITSFAAAVNCLTLLPSTPQINTINPATATVFSPGNATLTGSGFTGVTSYRVGLNTYTTGFNVISDNQMTIAIPEPTTTGWVTIDVTNPAGTSGVVVLQYTITSPPKLELNSTIPSTGGIANFEFAGTPGRQWFLVLGISSAQVPFQGYPLLANPLLLTSGSFSSPLGIESLPVPVPGGLGLLIFYTQILEADLTPAATGSSNVRVIVLL